MNFLIMGHPNGNMAVAQAKHLGFVVNAKVKLYHDPEIGTVVGHSPYLEGYPKENPPYCVSVQFERGTFNYRIRELSLVN
jgi:hypothetical protein